MIYIRQVSSILTSIAGGIFYEGIHIENVSVFHIRSSLHLIYHQNKY